MAQDGDRADARKQIQDSLKQVYSTYSDADVPDRFEMLMRQLKEKEAEPTPEDKS